MNITTMLRINVKKNINTVYRQYKKYGIIISFKIVRIIFISNPPMPCLNILPFIINMRFLTKKNRQTFLSTHSYVIGIALYRTSSIMKSCLHTMTAHFPTGSVLTKTVFRNNLFFFHITMKQEFVFCCLSLNIFPQYFSSKENILIKEIMC